MGHVLDPRKELADAEVFRPEALLAACYEDMRRVARSIMAGDGMRQKLQPTDLVNEASLRLIQSMPDRIADQGHMLAVAARTMRRVLIDEWETMGGPFQRFLAENGLSSHMWIAARRDV